MATHHFTPNNSKLRAGDCLLCLIYVGYLLSEVVVASSFIIDTFQLQEVGVVVSVSSASVIT
jgi:hypothetical protein